MEVIEITLELGKPMQVKVNGVTGPSCTTLTKVLEGLGTVETQELTPEYSQDESIHLTADQTIGL